MHNVFSWLTSTVLFLTLLVLGVRFAETLDKSLPPQSYLVLVNTPMNLHAMSFMLAIRMFWITRTGKLNGDFSRKNKLIWSTVFRALMTYFLLSNGLYALPVIPPFVKGVLDCGLGIAIGFTAYRYFDRQDPGDD